MAAVWCKQCVGLCASLYCVAAGLHLLSGWEDPISGADPEAVGNAASRGRGRGGIIILLIRFWPYALIVLGGWWASVYSYYLVSRR